MFNPARLIGHRGIKNLSPENTLHSINLALDLGLKWIEVDVKISRDYVPFLLHDDTLNRTTNGQGLAIDFNYNEIKNLDAGKYFFKKPTNIYPPKLEEVLEICSKKKIGINIELKPNKNFEIQNAEAVADLIKKTKLKNDYYFSSFDRLSLITINKLLPNSFLGILIDEFDKELNPDEILKFCNKNNLCCVGLSNKIANNDLIYLFKQNNLDITIYSENNITLEEAQNFWKLGVKSIFIDDIKDFFTKNN